MLIEVLKKTKKVFRLTVVVVLGRFVLTNWSHVGFRRLPGLIWHVIGLRAKKFGNCKNYLDELYGKHYYQQYWSKTIYFESLSQTLKYYFMC